MKIITIGISLITSCVVAYAQAPLDSAVVIGEDTLRASKTIIENLSRSKTHETFSAAIKASNLTNTLQGLGPYTVFAPMDVAFKKLPKGMWETWLKPDEKAILAKVLNYHIVAGLYDTKALAALVKEKNGQAQLKTLSGNTLYFTQSGNHILVWDENHKSAKIAPSNVNNSNGIIHVVDGVFQAKNK